MAATASVHREPKKDSERPDSSSVAMLSLAGVLTLVVIIASVIWIVTAGRLMIRSLYYELPSAPPNEGVTLQELDAEPWKFYGLQVTVSGKVLEDLDPHMRMIGNQRIFSGERVLVVSAVEPFPALLGTRVDRDDVVQVTGLVDVFDPVQVEFDYGIELEHPERLFPYEGEPVIILEEIELNPPVLREGQKRNQANSAGPEIGVTTQDVIYETEKYLGEIVMVSAEIEQRLSPEVFILGDHGVLVVGSEPFRNAVEEAAGYVTGEVRVFDRLALEEQLGIELEEALFSAYEGGPVIVAESLMVVR